MRKKKGGGDLIFIYLNLIIYFYREISKKMKEETYPQSTNNKIFKTSNKLINNNFPIKNPKDINTNNQINKYNNSSNPL